MNASSISAALMAALFVGIILSPGLAGVPATVEVADPLPEGPVPEIELSLNVTGIDFKAPRATVASWPCR